MGVEIVRGPPSRRLALLGSVAALLAVQQLTACGGQSEQVGETDDSGAGGVDGGGGAGGVNTGGVSTGGAGAQTGGLGGNVTPGGYGGTGQSCSWVSTIDCTGALPSGSPPHGTGSTCEEEGNFCEGTYPGGDLRTCFDIPYSEQCCNGRWMYAARAADGSLPTCPVPRMPGEPFPCGDNGLWCTAGQTECRTSYDERTGVAEWACSDLCPAADCSCYCEVDSFDGCGFDPPDAESPEDGCTCAPDLGTVNVVCNYYGPTIPDVCERDPSSDSQCPNADIRGTVYRCVSLPGDTNAAPRLPCDLLVGINEVIWWCCGSY